MKQESNFVKTLKDERGQAAFVGMVLFIVLTIIFSVFLGKRKIGFYGGLISSIISIANGEQFSKEYMRILNENEKGKK